jgi:hypothetical protein
VASHEANDELHRAMFIALYGPGGMVIKIAVGFVTFFYIVYKSEARKNFISPSFLGFS